DIFQRYPPSWIGDPKTISAFVDLVAFVAVELNQYCVLGFLYEDFDFNMWTWNNRVFPGIDPLPVRLGDKVRVRMANLTMTNHPMHLHGFRFAVTGTDGGWVPESAQWPHATVDVPVGEIRAIDFVAANPGDWAFHCHKSHHTMNAMGHNTRNLIGAK